MRFIKKCFRILTDESYIGAIARIVFCTVIILVVGFVLENTKKLGNQFLSDFMGGEFAKHNNGEKSTAYVIYYILLYAFVAMYAITSLLFCLYKKYSDVGWCVVSVVESVVFVVFINAYLTIMLQYKSTTDGANDATYMYTAHSTACNILATLICSVSGIKISFMLKQLKDREQEDEALWLQYVRYLIAVKGHSGDPYLEYYSRKLDIITNRDKATLAALEDKCERRDGKLLTAQEVLSQYYDELMEFPLYIGSEKK